MKIKIDQFCSLATATNWQEWLYRFSPQLYKELTDHLRVSKGCNHNREKMVELVHRILKTPNDGQQLIEFVQQHYPYMLEIDEAEQRKMMKSNSMDLPFSSASCKLLTFPRRIVLSNTNITILEQESKKFISDKLQSDYIIIGSQAFIEFVPREHGDVLQRIPKSNWLIMRWRTTHKIG